MLKLFVCCSLLVVLVSAAYDFQDSDFNGLLFDDLIESTDDDFLEPLRLRRAAVDGNDEAEPPKECNRKRGKKERDSHCCKGEKANPQELEAVREVKKNCIAEVREAAADDDSYDPLNCDKVQSMRQQMVCAAECMAKKFELLEANGELNRDALLNHTTKVVGNNKWQSGALEGFVDSCLAAMKSSKEVQSTDGAKEAKEAKCNPNPLEFHHCIWKKFVQGCPAESQIDSKKCKKIRERLAKGDNSYSEKSFKRGLRPRHRSNKHEDTY